MEVQLVGSYDLLQNLPLHENKTKLKNENSIWRNSPNHSEVCCSVNMSPEKLKAAKELKLLHLREQHWYWPKSARRTVWRNVTRNKDRQSITEITEGEGRGADEEPGVQEEGNEDLFKTGPKYPNIYIHLIRLLEVWSFSLFYQFKLLYIWKFWTAAVFSLTTQFMLTILNLEAR